MTEPVELAALLAPVRRVRLHAIRSAAPGDALAFALRRVLYSDRDAEVRAAAARRLGALPDERAAADEPSFVIGEREPSRAPHVLEGWLLDALGDHSPLVRDSIIRALAQVGSAASLPALRELAEHDGMWSIRRGAIYALAAVGGPAELPALTRALGDPFWRVRHAAVKVLAVLGARDPDVRDEVLAAPPSGTVTFLRAAWGPVALEAPARAGSASRLPSALLDPDPAVVHARLLEATAYDPVALVELLCDPHVPLRLVAARRIAASGSLPALEAALDWLEEPRIPHVADTVHWLLDGLGDPAAIIAQRVLQRGGPRRGAIRWAIEWVVATRFESLYEAARACARSGDAGARFAALRLMSDAELVEWAEPAIGALSPLVDQIAAELHTRRTDSARDALLSLDACVHPRSRALQIDVRARRGDWLPVEAAVGDRHHGPRAIAMRWLARRPDTVALAPDVDPAVREAALTPATAAAAATGDPDPWVRRAALRLLGEVHRDRTELPAEVAAAARAALVTGDPRLRAHACGLPITDDATLALVLECLADPDEGVRSAAHDAVDRMPRGDARVRAVLAALPSAARATAYGWLLRALDDTALAVARAALAGEADPLVRDVLAAVAQLAGREVVGGEVVSKDVVGAEVVGTDVVGKDVVGAEVVGDAVGPAVVTTGAPAPAAVAVERRPFGRAGFDVAPLAISGAYDLSTRSLHDAEAAGVDLYFWEPGYDVLQRFLRARERRNRARVITGTYHADPRAIRRDVDRALHQLRRETLDAFLLFWSRSPARVDGAAFAVLDELRRAGKLRAVGFSTHHRALAREAISGIEASPWDVVMIRHSAAHPGIESELLPSARLLNTAVVTFSALSYGRMISGARAPSPADCYRYSLSQPGVTACISAPRRHSELVENLGVLAAPVLSADQLAALRAHGAFVHAESQRFNTLVRQPTRDAAAAARELLASELPPETEATPRRFPQPSAARRSRTRLGAPRRGSR